MATPYTDAWRTLHNFKAQHAPALATMLDILEQAKDAEQFLESSAAGIASAKADLKKSQDDAAKAKDKADRLSADADAEAATILNDAKVAASTKVNEANAAVAKAYEALEADQSKAAITLARLNESIRLAQLDLANVRKERTNEQAVLDQVKGEIARVESTLAAARA